MSDHGVHNNHYDYDYSVMGGVASESMSTRVAIKHSKCQPIGCTNKIAIVAAVREFIWNTEWGSIGGFKQCAVRASVAEAIGTSNVGSKLPAVEHSQ